MARLAVVENQPDRIVLSLKDEKIIAELLVLLHIENLWNKDCAAVEESYLKWVVIYRDSLEKVFDLAEQHNININRFPTNDENGYRDYVKLRGLTNTERENAKKKFRDETSKRRCILVLNLLKRKNINIREAFQSFKNIQQIELEDECKLEAFEKKMDYAFGISNQNDVLLLRSLDNAFGMIQEALKKQEESIASLHRLIREKNSS